MVFGVIAGGMFVMLGPTVGAVFTLLLQEGLRLALGDAFKQFPALDLAIYGMLLVLFIIYMPKGILGAALDAMRAPAAKSPTPAPAPR
jgi:branched-chain amino acid transport system permease protein